jgi:hypothetical protein
LRAVDPAFVPARRAELDGEVRVHDAGRAAALRALRGRSDAMSRAVVEALCQGDVAAPLTAECAAAGRGKTKALLFPGARSSPAPRP